MAELQLQTGPGADGFGGQMDRRRQLRRLAIVDREAQVLVLEGEAGMVGAQGPEPLARGVQSRIRRRLLDEVVGPPADQAVDRRHRDDRALQDTVDLFQAAAADHRQPPVQPLAQMTEQVGAPGLGAHVPGPRLDRRQGAVQVEEQGDVVEPRQRTGPGQQSRRRGVHALPLSGVIAVTISDGLRRG